MPMSPIGAGAEIPEPAPLERHVGGVVRPLRRRAEPDVPVESRRDRRRVGRPRDALRPPAGGAVRPDVQLRDVADRAGADHLHGPARALEGVALRAHLRRDARARPATLRHLAALPRSLCASGFSQ